MRILVTGGGGFVGRHLVARLVHAGHTVAVFDKFDGPGPPPAFEALWPAVTVTAGDLLDAGAIQKAMAAASPDAVVHAAALVGPRLSLDEPLLTTRVNVEGTINVLDALRVHGKARGILVSTEEVYGEFERDPAPEDHPVRPLNPYGISKAAAEWYVEFYQRHHGLDLYVARTSWVYGPGFPRVRLETTIIADALRGKESVFASGADQRTDYTYVGDLIEGLRLLLERPAPASRIYNIGSGRSRSMAEVVAILRRLLPGAKVTLGPGRLEYAPGVPMPQKGGLDISRARRDLGYEPRMDLATGLTRCVEAARLGPGA